MKRTMLFWRYTDYIYYIFKNNGILRLLTGYFDHIRTWKVCVTIILTVSEFSITTVCKFGSCVSLCVCAWLKLLKYINLTRLDLLDRFRLRRCLVNQKECALSTVCGDAHTSVLMEHWAFVTRSWPSSVLCRMPSAGRVISHVRRFATYGTLPHGYVSCQSTFWLAGRFTRYASRHSASQSVKAVEHVSVKSRSRTAKVLLIYITPAYIHMLWWHHYLHNTSLPEAHTEILTYSDYDIVDLKQIHEVTVNMAKN